MMQNVSWSVFARQSKKARLDLTFFTFENRFEGDNIISKAFFKIRKSLAAVYLILEDNNVIFHLVHYVQIS